MTDSISRSRFLKTVAAGSLGAGLIGISESVSKADPLKPISGNHSFKIRGFHIDLRSEVMTVEALKSLAKELSGDGINAIVMEYEATYPYRDHVTLHNPYTYSRQEIRDYVSYCESLGIQVIPLQECLGHAQYILRHDRYASMRVHPDIISQIDPLNEDAVPLFTELIDDLVSLHPSGYVHVGGDEVGHLTDPKYAQFLKKYGVSRLYTQYMNKICRIVIDYDKTPLLWTDMILAHPEAVNDLPVDKIIFVDWNYGWDINQFGNISDLKKKGCRFWGSPALRSHPDNDYITRWQKHFNNLKDYIPYTRNAGYEGVIMTSWSTSGVYGYEWDTDNEVLDMFPIRNVYPLSGFRILWSAYARAISEEKPLDPHDFVLRYGRERFGLTGQDSEKLWQYFTHEQVLVVRGKPENGEDLERVVENFRKIQDLVHQIKPVKNENEFEHFRLMADIRNHYLSVKLVEKQIGEFRSGTSDSGIITQKLALLTKESNRLDNRFTELNDKFLKAGELDRLNRLRNLKLGSISESWDLVTRS